MTVLNSLCFCLSVLFFGFYFLVFLCIFIVLQRVLEVQFALIPS